jgi:hypothetical protein
MKNSLHDLPGFRSTHGSAETDERGRAHSLKIEVLYFEGCPNHGVLLPRLLELLAQTGVTTEVELVEVPDHVAAERQRFLGSPTLRIDGRDVEPGAELRTDFGVKCRLYRTADGVTGTPPDEWVLTALNRRRRF